MSRMEWKKLIFCGKIQIIKEKFSGVRIIHKHNELIYGEISRPVR